MVFSPTEIEAKLERVLLRVQKPGRYVGGELNQIIKEWDAIETHVALAFPDIYDIGLPNLGLAIFYHALNARPDVLAERAYVPWTDMEVQMREQHIPLYSLESKHALVDFDILGFTLPYESLYTNALNLLDLAGIPLFADQRTAAHPLVIAGGHATYNPEPMHAFIDAFVIGEGEEVIHEIVAAYQTWKRSAQPRAALLQALAQIQGVYVPSLYKVEYNSDHTISAIYPFSQEATQNPQSPTRATQNDLSSPSLRASVVKFPKITKRLVGKLPPPPTRFIVPNVDVVHNRVSIEIMRGCTRGCRFCHAGMINRPVRERPVAEIVDALEESLAQTGFEEIALLSLSSSDYTHVLDLVQAVSERFAGKHVTISLPSLRIESFSVDLLDKLKGARQGGFTLAPEAATERMRNIINKPIPTQQLLDVTRAIYERGWQTIKLYFMIGHPSETLEDVQAIADLCKLVLAEGRKVIGRRASLHAGVSTFVPKPHTPFQWVPCDTIDQIEAKQRLLRHTLSGPGLKMSWTAPKDTMLEAWLSRGDRRMADVIFAAWQQGAKFDAWQDQYRFAAWENAFIEVGIDSAFYTHRVRYLDEIFPWDHISAGVRKSYLTQDYNRSLEGQTRPDCRQQCYACGILPTFASLRRLHPGEGWKCPEVSQGRVRAVGSPDSPEANSDQTSEVSSVQEA
jgi:radical SAM family uncharacterized protein